MPSRIKIKVGVIEVEYEGEEKFIKDELPSLIKTVAALHEQTGPMSPFVDSDDKTSTRENSIAGSTLTTSSIAAKLGCKTGPDLIIAAAAHLGLIKQQSQYTRAEIVREMKGATAFFNKNFVSNLSKSLKTLVQSDQLNEVGTDTYALPSTETAKLKTKLGL